ncbi:type III secretion system translocon subunit SctE (plasmid) [Bradyrhizobium sp. Pa8]|uniref:type III secretion system translocon subunit SctE n=1 Tax=Bradyrhizobium sp. Pa8 TaxID=3386552 RepID=UPI00403F79B8
MRSLNLMRVSIRTTLPELEAPPPFNDSAAGLSADGHRTDVNLLPPRVSGGAATSHANPSLPPPRAFDAIDLLSTALALKTKITDGLVVAGMQDARHWGEQQRLLHEKISRSIIDAAEKLAESKKSSGIMKLFGWLAVGLTVIAAVATGGTLAVTAAAVTVGVATLVETGVVDKMTEAITKSLIKDGMEDGAANTLAIAITIGIMLAISVLTAGTGFASGAANGSRTTAMWSRFGQAAAPALRGLATIAASPGTVGTAIGRIVAQAARDAAEIASNAAKVVQISQRISTAARVGEAVASLGAASAGIANGVQQKEATDTQAEMLEIRSGIARLRELQSNEVDFINQLLRDKMTTTRKVAEAIEGQSYSNSDLMRHFS